MFSHSNNIRSTVANEIHTCVGTAVLNSQSVNNMFDKEEVFPPLYPFQTDECYLMPRHQNKFRKASLIDDIHFLVHFHKQF